MKILFNGNSMKIDVLTNIHDLLSMYQIELQGIAVAINQRLCPKTEWGETYLQEGDSILIIQATQGG
ncbi:sulfur carrier protein ThiS [Halosquirtibacter laminarini]|uniref:Sulfur carrier protein ThiS n=1 Tax=Halosquirtibacter laminarini TaxID=3374600 RepID=A0AC61NQC1_9BACT|nr:sulfur carrier protein ThiS [Prolixibacteraceae bacterium]